MAIDLTGAYQDREGRPYVVMQDDAQRTDRVAYIAFVRVMRQRDEEVVNGTVFVADDTFAAAGDDDAARNLAIGRSLVDWIAASPPEPHFQLRATLDRVEDAPAIAMLSEDYGRTKGRTA